MEIKHYQPPTYWENMHEIYSGFTLDLFVILLFSFIMTVCVTLVMMIDTEKFKFKHIVRSITIFVISMLVTSLMFNMIKTSTLKDNSIYTVHGEAKVTKVVLDDDGQSIYFEHDHQRFYVDGQPKKDIVEKGDIIQLDTNDKALINDDGEIRGYDNSDDLKVHYKHQK